MDSLSNVGKQHQKHEKMKGLEAEVKHFAPLCKEIFARMRSRGEKNKKSGYKWFLNGIQALKKVPGYKEQSIFLENFYAVMRYVDDVVDGDVKLPAGYTSAITYVEEKIKFVETKDMPPRDEIEKYIALCFKLGAEFQHDFHKETKDILSSLLFDARRRDTHETFDENTLHNHFYLLDTRGTIEGALKLFGEDPELYHVLEPLGEATRIYYNLRDFREDVAAGLVNISSGDCARLNISQDELAKNHYENHSGVYTWFKEQAKKGLGLIEEYHRKKKGVNFKPVTEVALKLAFEAKAKLFMSAVAKGKHDKVLGKVAGKVA